MEVGDQIIVYFFLNVPPVILMCPTRGDMIICQEISVPQVIF